MRCPIAGDGVHVPEGTCGLCGQAYPWRLEDAAAGQESGWETLNVKVISFKHRDITKLAGFVSDHLQRAYLGHEVDGEAELVLTLVTRKAWPPFE